MNVIDCLWMQQLKWWAQTQSNSLDIFERDCLWKETTGNLWTLLEYLKPARGQAQMAGNDSHVSDFCTYYSALPAKKYIFSIVSTPQESNQGEKALIVLYIFWKVENGLRVAWQCRSEKQSLFWEEFLCLLDLELSWLLQALSDPSNSKD